jgi:Zn ribbon nucleic-acid-binding protein
MPINVDNCPQCKNSNDLFLHVTKNLSHFIECPVCGTRGPVAKSGGAAIRAWQSRDRDGFIEQSDPPKKSGAGQ